MIIINSVSDGGVPVNFVFPCPFFQFSAKNHLDFFVYLKKFTLNINRNGYCLMKIWIFTFVFGMFDLASIDEDDVIEKSKNQIFSNGKQNLRSDRFIHPICHAKDENQKKVSHIVTRDKLKFKEKKKKKKR